MNLLTLLVVLCVTPESAPARVEAANTHASAKTVRVLGYLAGMTKQQENRVVSGQHCGRGKEAETLYRDHIVEMHRATGHWIAMVGTDYGRGRHDTADPDAAAANRVLIDHWKNDGLVTVTWHAANPWTGGTAWDRKAVKLADLVTPASDVHAAWMRQLDRVATGLAQLRDAGVVVLWRPLHEMNGGWFWWGRRERAEYVAVWLHMFEYFTETKKLDNLLWVYSASARHQVPADLYYPGAAYCDIVGLDHYADAFDLPGYRELTALGKPFGLTEVGPKRDLRGSFDYAKLIVAIKERYPETTFFQAWAWGWSIAENKNAKALLGDSWIVGRDELAGRVR